MPAPKNSWTSLILLVAAILLLEAMPSPAETREPFPKYSCLEPNVNFWIKVFAEFTTTQGLVHDSENLAIVYEVIDLSPENSSANEAAVKAKYRALLERLAQGAPPATPAESRVLSLFGRNPSASVLEKAANSVRVQRGQKDRFLAGLVRSGAYMDQIKQIFRDHGLPEDLAYLPHVESSFDTRAFSKSGAAGIWQFTKGTGKRFLMVDNLVDERYDPLRASHAAADFLKENYAFLGDWPLALTAYNHGAYGMKNAQEAVGSYETIFRTYYGPKFGFASRNFYSEFLAVREIAKNYNHHFGTVALDHASSFKEIALPGAASLGDVRRAFGVDEALVRSLNPALREPVLTGQRYIPRGYKLRLPAGAGGETGALAAQKETKPTTAQVAAKSTPLEQQKFGHTHRVKKGETLSRIARTYGVSTNAIVAANNLGSIGTIKIGQNLVIPAGALAGEKKTATVVAEKSQTPAKTSPEQVADSKPAVEKETAEVSADQPGNAGVSSNRYAVSKKDRVKGQEIGLIRVEAEETLTQYAKWLEVSVEDIRRLNGFSPGRNVTLHNQVKIPLTKVTRERFEERRAGFHRSLEQEFYASFKIARVKEYSIKNGDNIWSICTQKFDVPIWLVSKYNAEVDLHNLKTAQKLRIPIPEKIT